LERDSLVRFGVSMPHSLVEQFDELLAEQGYGNRSEAIRDLVRKSLLEPGHLQPTQVVAGTIVMVYNHHVPELPAYLTDLQHEHHREIISTMHIHLNRDQCLEIIVVRGKLDSLRKLYGRIQVQKGVSFAELSVTHFEKDGPESSHASHRSQKGG